MTGLLETVVQGEVASVNQIFSGPVSGNALLLLDDDAALLLTQLLTGGGFGDVRLETLTRPFRIGRTIGDAVNFILSLPESKQLFAGAPQDTVDAAATALHAGFAPTPDSREW